MIYELRIYRLAPGRMPDAVDRFQKLPAIFGRLGLPLMGRWQSLVGPDSPSIVYLLGFTDFAEREARWPSFYTDPAWLALRAETNDGEEQILGFETLFLKDSPVWQPDMQTDANAPGIYDLKLIRVGVGQIPRAHRLLQDLTLPGIARSGGQAVLCADVVSGGAMPGCALIGRWPNVESWHRACIATASDPEARRRLRADRAEPGGEALGTWRHWLLEPIRNSYQPAGQS